MGGGNWSSQSYQDRQVTRQRTSTPAFSHTAAMLQRAASDWKADPRLNPMDLKIRESRDSDAHPESRAIMIQLDDSGSLGIYAEEIQKNLDQLMKLLIQYGYEPHPAISFCGIGDAQCDRVPLQVGQFESGIEIDDVLTHIFLEHGGGGQMYESYDLGLLVAARHTSIDCWEKRQKKGFLILLGDEKCRDEVDPGEVRAVLGDSLEAPIPIETIIAEVKKTWIPFFIMTPGDYYGREQEIMDDWRRKIGGEFVLKMGDDPASISGLIASQIGMLNGVVDRRKALANLKEVGVAASAISSISSALVPFDATGTDGVVPVASTPAGISRHGVTRT